MISTLEVWGSARIDQDQSSPSRLQGQDQSGSQLASAGSGDALGQGIFMRQAGQGFD